MKKETIINGIDVSKCEYLDWQEHCLERIKNEQGELRKYIIDICDLLDINTKQSLLGSNCLEFYAVLSSTAENKIKELKEWQEANQPTGICETCTAKSVEDMYKYKKALDKIKRIVMGANSISQLDTDNIKQILNVINKVKEK